MSGTICFIALVLALAFVGCSDFGGPPKAERIDYFPLVESSEHGKFEIGYSISRVPGHYKGAVSGCSLIDLSDGSIHPIKLNPQHSLQEVVDNGSRLWSPDGKHLIIPQGFDGLDVFVSDGGLPGNIAKRVSQKRLVIEMAGVPFRHLYSGWVSEKEFRFSVELSGEELEISADIIGETLTRMDNQQVANWDEVVDINRFQ